MTSLRIVASLLGPLMALAPARAQEPTSPYETNLTGPVEWNLGGTLAIPTGPSADRVQVGGGFTLGVTFNAKPAMGIQLEYAVNWSNLENSGPVGTSLEGHTLLQYVDANFIYRPVRGGRSGLYLVGGGGLYYRDVTVTRSQGTTVAPYCDPYLFYCSLVPVEAVSVVGSRSRWDWGLDAGIGYTFGIAPPVRVYLEVRYHYIFGPTFHDASGSERKADGQYVPITLGIRF